MSMTCPLCLAQQSKKYHSYQDKRYGLREFFRCPQCDLIFLNPSHFLSKKDEKARYDTHNNDPDDENYQHFLKRLIDPLKAILIEKMNCRADASNDKMKLLDYGCGPGPTIGEILKNEQVVVENYDPYYFPNKRLLNQMYDVVVSTETIEHFYYPRREFEKIINCLLTENGFLAVMTQVLEGQEKFENWWYIKDPTHVSFYSRKTFLWLAENHQLDIVFIKKGAVIFQKK